MFKNYLKIALRNIRKNPGFSFINPVAYIIMRSWLQKFAYRAGIGLGSFILTAILTFLLALLSVGYQSLRAAVADPVKSLRYE